MKKVYSKIQDVIELFVTQSQDEGRNSRGNISFEKNVLYSYGHYAIIKIYDRFALVQCNKYSVTTSKHINWTYWELQRNNIEIISVPNILEFSQENLNYLKEQIKIYLKKYKNATLHKEWYYTSTIEAVNNYRRYIKNIKNKNKPLLFANELKLEQLEKLKQSIYEDKKRRTINNCLMSRGLFKKIQNKTLKPDDIFKERNAQRRGVLLGLYTYEKLLLNTKSKVIHTEGEYQLTLIETPKTHSAMQGWGENRTEIKLPEDIVLLKVRDTSTGVFYVLRVPPTMKTCKEARAWTFGLKEQDLDFVIRES